jgi:hypothetical protein
VSKNRPQHYLKENKGNEPKELRRLATRLISVPVDPSLPLYYSCKLICCILVLNRLQKLGTFRESL